MKHEWKKQGATHKEAAYIRLSRWRRRKLWRLSEAQNHRCCYCGRETHFNDTGPRIGAARATLEHLIPISTPVQTNKDENLVMACTECNSLRARSNPIKFFELIHTAPPPPQKPKVIVPTAEELAKQHMKTQRTFNYVFTLMTFWPQWAERFLKEYDAKPAHWHYEQIRTKKRRPSKIRAVQRRIHMQTRHPSPTHTIQA